MITRRVRLVAVGLVAGWGILGALFVDGELLGDPGGWRGVGLVVLCDLPLAVLAWLALARPATAARVLPVVLAVVGVLVVLDAVRDLVPHDRWGPVGAVAVLVVAVPCGLLGLHLAGRAGGLLLAAAAVTLVSSLAQLDRAGGQPVLHVLRGSQGVSLVPLLLLALLFLTVAALEHSRHRRVDRPWAPAGSGT